MYLTYMDPSVSRCCDATQTTVLFAHQQHWPLLANNGHHLLAIISIFLVHHILCLILQNATKTLLRTDEERQCKFTNHKLQSTVFCRKLCQILWVILQKSAAFCGKIIKILWFTEACPFMSNLSCLLFSY